VDEQEGPMGGSEGDIHSLYHWSWMALIVFWVAAIAWGFFGLVFFIYPGVTWYDWDMASGSTKAVSDLSWGIIFLALAIITAFIARFLWNDIVVTFKARRFQVPREKLVVYSMFGFPLTLGVAGVLLVLVNIKLSNPEFLPSHAEAYPEELAWPAGRAPPPVEVEVPAPVEEPTPAELPAPAEAPEMEELPTPAPAPVAMEPAPAPAPIQAIVEEVPTAPEAAPAEAFYEELPPGEVPVAPGAPMAAIVEEVPLEEAPPAIVEAIVEEMPVEDEGEFEIVEEFEEVAEEEEAPKDIHEAHEELLGKLLGK
jgi:hypothetical protein